MGSFNLGRAFFSKETEIEQVLTERDLDVLFLQEIDIKHFHEGLLCFQGYSCFVNEGPRKQVATFIKKGIFKSVLLLPPPVNLPQTWILVEEHSGRKTILVNMYREWSTQQDLELTLFFTAVHERSVDRILIRGDFNLDTSRGNDPRYHCRGHLRRMVDESLTAGLQMTPFGPTFHRIVEGEKVDSDLDWVLSNLDILATEKNHYGGLGP